MYLQCVGINTVLKVHLTTGPLLDCLRDPCSIFIESTFRSSINQCQATVKAISISSNLSNDVSAIYIFHQIKIVSSIKYIHVWQYRFIVRVIINVSLIANTTRLGFGCLLLGYLSGPELTKVNRYTNCSRLQSAF